MRALEPISDDPLELFDTIIEVKKDKAPLLRALRNRVAEAYSRYEQKGRKLHRMDPLPGLYPRQVEALLHCYKPTVPRDIVYKKILALSYWCPYCTIVQVQSLDHYLSKASFPEFSIFPKNLVPACDSCNTPGKRHKEDGRRVLVHPYFDELPRVNPWKATVRVVNGVPEATFEVDRAVDAEGLLARHAENLGLVDRYYAWAMKGGGLSGIVLTIHRGAARDEARRHLLEQAEAEERAKEPNLARGALLRGAARSDEFLDVAAGKAP